MSTYGDLISDVESFMSSFGTVRDKVTSLTAAMTDTDLTLTVDDGKQVDRGFIEVDQELMAVKTVDVSTGLVTLHPWGRGQKGTTAAAHLINGKVTSNPRISRFRIGQEINTVIASIYPNLFAVGMDETNSSSPVVVTYPMPAVAESIVSVSYQSIGPTKVWLPVTRYKLDNNADTTAFPTGKSLDIYQPMSPGRKIKVVYRRPFGTFAAESDTFASVFLDEGWRDLIRMFALSRLLVGLEPERLELDSVESANRAAFTQPMQAAGVARQFAQQAQQRLADERRRLLTKYPSTQVRMS